MLMFEVMSSFIHKEDGEWTLVTLISEDIVNICVLKDIRPLGIFAQAGEVYLGIKVFWKDVFS